MISETYPMTICKCLLIVFLASNNLYHCSQVVKYKDSKFLSRIYCHQFKDSIDHSPDEKIKDTERNPAGNEAGVERSKAALGNSIQSG